jgi:phage baseplate assembly protein W
VQTLALVHGDLSIDSSGQYATFSGADRIRQDMTLALTEIYGANKFHPKWGSILENYIGNPLTTNLQQLVQAEVNRVVQNYIVLQQAQVLRNTTYDISGVFDTSDVVQAVGPISVSNAMDTIYVSATLTTVARQTITITRQVGASS